MVTRTGMVSVARALPIPDFCEAPLLGCCYVLTELASLLPVPPFEQRGPWPTRLKNCFAALREA